MQKVKKNTRERKIIHWERKIIQIFTATTRTNEAVVRDSSGS